MSTPTTPLPSALTANAVRAQFAGRPTLEGVTRQLLAAAFSEKYPTLKIDLARTRLAVPRVGGGWELQPFVARVMDYLANGNVLNLEMIDGQSYYLCDDAPNWLEPDLLDMKVIDALVRELTWTVPAGFQNALAEYWSGQADTGVSRWRWFSDVLKDTLSIGLIQQEDLSDLARETINQVILCPDREGRVLQYGEHCAQVYCLESTLIGTQASSTRLTSSIVLVRAHLVLMCRPNGTVKSFPSVDAAIEYGGQRMGAAYVADEVRIKRYELEGNVFDVQAAIILGRQLESLGALKLPARVGVEALQTVCLNLSEPAQYLLAAPATDGRAVDMLNAHLPDWLRQASAAEQSQYRQYSLALARAKKSSQGRTFLSGIADIRSFAIDVLTQQMQLDQERLELDSSRHVSVEAFNPDHVELTFFSAAGFPNAIPVTETVIMSLTELALKNLVGRPEGVLSLKHSHGLALPVWLTPDYIISSNGLIERVDIGKVYPERLQSLLLGTTSDARKREQLFAEQISAYLPLQALELSLKKENGLSPHGARYVAALMQSDAADRQVDGVPVVIRHLAMVRKSGAAPDVVNNMFIIEPADMSVGPHLLYRPFYHQALHEFATRAALLEAVAQPGELQTSVLVWLSNVARPIYDNGGFQEPHYVRFGLGSDFSPLEVPQPATLSVDGASDELLQYLHNGKLLQFLYISNASALVSQAERDSVSNTESRWGVLLERTNLIFNLVLLPFLSVPTLLTVGLSVMLLAAIKDIPALNSQDPITRELGLVDLLLNLAMVLFPLPASVPARPLLADGVREQVVKPRAPERSADRWPELPSPRVSAGAVAFPGELPDVQSTPLDFSFASSQNRLTPNQRKMLSRFEVNKPAQMPQPILHNPRADEPRKGLYVIDNKWHALVEDTLYEIDVGLEGVVIVDPADGNHFGPYLKSSGDGRWSLDLRLRLSGGMPKARLQALRETKNARRQELLDQWEKLNEETPKMNATFQVSISVMERAEKDPRFTEEQRSVYRRKAESATQQLIDSYLLLLANLDEFKSLFPDVKKYDIDDRILALATECNHLLVIYDHDLKGVPFRVLEMASSSNTLRFDQVMKAYIDIYEKMIATLELRARYLERLDQAGMQRYESSLEDVSLKRTNVDFYDVSIKNSYLNWLIKPSVKEWQRNTALVETLEGLVTPVRKLISTHVELNTFDFSSGESLEVVSSLVDFYAQSLDALRGLGILRADELDSVFFNKIITMLDGLYQDVAKKMAAEIKPGAKAAELPDKPHRAPTTGAPKRIIKTRNSGRLIGKLIPAGGEWPVEVVEVRSEENDQLLGTYSEHGEVWDEIKVVTPMAPSATRPLDILKGEARKGYADLDKHLRRAEEYKKISRYPQEVQEVLQHEADRLNRLAAELSKAIDAQPLNTVVQSDLVLVENLRSGATRLTEKGKELRIQLSLELPPTHGNLQYLLDQDRVQIAGLGARIKLAGERQDFIQEYAINDKKGAPLWYAHIHYAEAETPKENYGVAHLKLKSQRRESYYSQLKKSKSPQATVNVYHGVIGKDLVERWFLPLDNH
ncbi:dermonecrotic toxin domain-containing protein [Pseudomonas sp. CCC3.1]|uniref:dermonecrotic toxin domain-containing protein n=1 Tax=Pseudomonas sp. CCC3.1 TaxID=3048607 RepID=UPI002AC96045|nr:DUF6543 domain-containing protein [Pseudomonas sp. CCC3.1]MEB0207266.1 hypothetical protein [Pseudomonas sp. CCC3.1]WPX34616.1 hypothetical protein RHM56_14995 [Pseudomonas sp. CCC3.1]